MAQTIDLTGNVVHDIGKGDINGRSQAIMEMAGLTRREKEIVMELCVGTSPANISKRLHISLATTHKHIAHIYSKLRVSNLQEMLVKLLNPRDSARGLNE